jgi:peptidoglycan/xylan/chitin deacetylase (PgdA/CDA1 family)
MAVDAAPPASDSAPALFDATALLAHVSDHSAPRTRALGAYYLAKPLIPRRAQLAARRVYARRQARRAQLGWPIEPALVHELHRRLREESDRRGGEAVPFVNFWPDRKRFAFVLTHDVEGPAGLANIERVLELERRHGLRSAWNLVAEDYEIPSGLFERLRAAGCEIALHGVTHDGSLFASRREFEAQLPRIERYLREWGAVGFRSPATHRNAAWMPELGCLYDSSFPDTDPFEPQAGGCRSILPFFLGELVELPITLPQDHTLFEILRVRSSELWIGKCRWLIAARGLVNVLVHPDYVIGRERLDLYDQLLSYLAAQSDGWHALPRDVASWWRARAALVRGERPRSASDWQQRATIAFAHPAAGGGVQLVI